MGVFPRKCLICGTSIGSAVGTDIHAPPSGAVEWQTYGNFGSTVFDSDGGAMLSIVICDKCMIDVQERILMINMTTDAENSSDWDPESPSPEFEYSMEDLESLRTLADNLQSSFDDVMKERGARKKYLTTHECPHEVNSKEWALWEAEKRWDSYMVNDYVDQDNAHWFIICGDADDSGEKGVTWGIVGTGKSWVGALKDADEQTKKQ